MKTAREHAVDLELAHVTEFGPLTEIRDREIRSEAFMESLLILRNLAAGHMTPALETTLAMLEKAIGKRMGGS
jgi:hypothetical protein